MAAHPLKTEAAFRKFHRMFAPGAMTDREITELGRRYAKLQVLWYHFLTKPHYKPDTVLLHHVLCDPRFSRATRGEPALILYVLRQKVRYGVLTLRLYPFFSKQLTIAKDPQFTSLLARLIAESLSKRAVTSFGVPNTASATAALRVEYAFLCEDAIFQKVPQQLREALFSLYRRLLPTATGKYSKWQVNAMNVSPFSAPSVIRHIQKFGPKYENEFIQSLVRQGCVADMHDIMRAYPKLTPMVRRALKEATVRARANAAAPKAVVR